MAHEIHIDPYLKEYREHGEIFVCGRWSMDEAETLEEAADMLRMYADELDALAHAGFHLMGPIEDDHGFAHRAPDRESPGREHVPVARHHLNEDPPQAAS